MLSVHGEWIRAGGSAKGHRACIQINARYSQRDDEGVKKEMQIISKTVNKVLLLGNVGRDPEIASTNGGTLVARLLPATSERFRDKQGDGRSVEETGDFEILGITDREIPF
jgi:Single-strand binding protein family